MFLTRLLVSLTFFAALSPLHASPLLRRVVPPGIPVDNIDTFDSLVLALANPGMNAGAIVLIEPGSNPGFISNNILQTAQNNTPGGFTIQGPSDTNPAELPPILIPEPVSVFAPTMQFINVNLQFTDEGRLTSTAPNFYLKRCELTHFESNSNGIIQIGSSNAIVEDNRISGPGDQMLVLATAQSAKIQHNEFTLNAANQQITFEANGGFTGHLVDGNVFTANRGLISTAQIAVFEGTHNLTIRNNHFVDMDTASPSILAYYGSLNLNIRANRFDIAAGATTGVIQVNGGNGALNSNFQVVGNNINLKGAGGLGMWLAAPLAATYSGKIEGNRVRGALGVSLQSSGASLSNVDLGGGTQSSLGGNNFRVYTAAAGNANGAIRTGTGAGNVSAEGNLFSVAPEFVIYDANDDATRFNVDAFPSQSGNEAYVAALYSRFLRRAANHADDTDAGAVVAQLNAKKPASLIAKNIVRSPDALTFVVNEAYHTALRRGPTFQELAAGILYTSRRREEDFLLSLLNTPEGRRLYSSERALSTKAFTAFLGRLPTSDENTTFAAMASRSRLKALQTILRSAEFTQRRTALVFDDLLRRQPNADELKKYRAFDRLKLLQTLAASVEFQNAG